ncbi:hypothetical protein [Phaffia rhodozyma]|uniref:Uncharacterized protein n=1 Tax=Phaffia rhodozyma TaxID=264483 RepID=A0A0F7SG79_PHARH|nr:hypothetical protein [Phaffia rhodozyma]
MSDNATIPLRQPYHLSRCLTGRSLLSARIEREVIQDAGKMNVTVDGSQAELDIVGFVKDAGSDSIIVVLGWRPVGRLMVGFIWACWVWNKRPVESWESGGGLFLSLIGVLVALIAVGLFISTSLSINRGISPIESRIYLNYRRIDPRLYNAAFPPSPPPLTERLALNSVSSHTLLSVSRADPRVLIWIPHPTVKGRGKAVYTRPDEKPFDLGWRENWKTVWREGIRDGFRVWSRGSVSDSAGASVDVSSSGNEARKRGLIALNENVLHRLRYEASLAFDEEDEEEEQAQYGSDDEGDLVVL